MPGFLASIKTRYEEGPEIAIDCPLCRRECVLAGSFRRYESIRLFFFIPLGGAGTTTIVCSHCQQSVYSTLSLAALSKATPRQIQRSLTRPDRFAAIVFFIFAMLTCWLPCVGLIPAITVPVANRYARGVWWWLGFVPLVLALVVTTLVVVAAIW